MPYLSILVEWFLQIYLSNAHSNGKLPIIAFLLPEIWGLFVDLYMVIELDDFARGYAKRRLL